MGQSSISMLNKVGYSMFWSSMWDNKVNYSRGLKEDIFFSKFFDYIFNDNVSVNIIDYKKKNQKIFKNYGINIDNSFSLFNYFSVYNKIKLISSKLWILKYQNWLIFYKFIFIDDKKKLNDIINCRYGKNFFYNFKFYKKALNTINHNFSKRKNYPNPFIF